MVELHNMTPHDPLVFHAEDGRTVALPAIGAVRLDEVTRPLEAITVAWTWAEASPAESEVPVVDVDYLPGDGLPQQRPGVVLIVSQLVAVMFPARADLVFPTQLVRDAAGTVTGFRALGRPHS